MASAPMWTSKLGNRYPKDLIERLDEEHHRTLKALRKLPHNSRCAECGAADTTWASVNLGVFVCYSCSDVHRGVGTHISKVKGCTGTYLWGPDEIARMQEIGNALAEKRYGVHPRPAESASKDERMALCRQKYSRPRDLAQGDGQLSHDRPPQPAAAREAQSTARATPASVTGSAATVIAARSRPAVAQWRPSTETFAANLRYGRIPLASQLEGFDADAFFKSLETPEACESTPAAPMAMAQRSGQPATTVEPTGSLDDFMDQCLGVSGAAAAAAVCKPASTSGSLLDDFLNW